MGKPQIFIPVAIVMRVIRLWPMMMFVTAIQWQWADQLPYGYNVWQRDKFTVGCNNNWYKILLFYHIFDKRGGECMDVLWYVQVCS